MKCPFCGEELRFDDKTKAGFTCVHKKCKGSKYVLSAELWEVLIDKERYAEVYTIATKTIEDCRNALNKQAQYTKDARTRAFCVCHGSHLSTGLKDIENILNKEK